MGAARGGRVAITLADVIAATAFSTTSDATTRAFRINMVGITIVIVIIINGISSEVRGTRGHAKIQYIA